MGLVNLPRSGRLQRTYKEDFHIKIYGKSWAEGDYCGSLKMLKLPH